jgi:CO dehydrogenase maturation factor
MPHTIAITGKGGVGKTTVAALVVLRLIARGQRPILAVDADPNSCLDSALGVRVEHTVGGIREEARVLAGEGKTGGVAKQDLLKIKIARSLVETDDFDLIAMGRSEGPGCYCFANNALRTTLTEIADDYPFAVIDNEAGLENLSRRIVRKVDLMIMVADPSRQGLETVRRLFALAKEMGTKLKKLALVINRLRGEDLPPEAARLQAETGACVVVGLPEDAELGRMAEAGAPLRGVSPLNPVVTGLDRLLADAGVLEKNAGQGK